jgi:peptidoglycan-associated lipoprotein
MRQAILWAAVLLLVAGCPSKKPKYPLCDGDKDCKAGEKCVNKKCLQCALDTDCPEGQQCVDGACKPKEGWCSGDGDCPDGKVCKDHACVPCTANGECGEGGQCREGKCLRKGQCETDEDCPEDQDCVNGFCKGSGGSGSQIPSCNLENIAFGFDQYNLDDAAKAILQKNMECISQTTLSVNVIGHTDARGTEEYNIGLSDDRAQAVITYLTRLGVDPGRLKKVPKGSVDAMGSDEAGYAKDRRVEFQWQ